LALAREDLALARGAALSSGLVTGLSSGLVTGLSSGWLRGSSIATGAARLGLGYRLGLGIGVQRGFDNFGGLMVGRGFRQRLLLLRRRFEGWDFQFGVQGCTLGFGIEDVCHRLPAPRFRAPAAKNTCRWVLPQLRLPSTRDAGGHLPACKDMLVTVANPQGTVPPAGQAAWTASGLHGKHPAGNGLLEGGRNSLLESAQGATLISVATAALPVNATDCTSVLQTQFFRPGCAKNVELRSISPPAPPPSILMQTDPTDGLSLDSWRYAYITAADCNERAGVPRRWRLEWRSWLRLLQPDRVH